MTVPWQSTYGAVLLLAERQWLKDAAAEIVRRYKSPTIVNIGVFEYASMYCLRAGAPEARLFGVDIEIQPVEIHPELQAEFIWGDSLICHANFKGPIHLLFIDGDHDYPVVKADIANWTPKIVPGGVVAFHDYAPTKKNLIEHELEGVRRAIDEWAAKAKWLRVNATGSLVSFRRPA